MQTDGPITSKRVMVYGYGFVDSLQNIGSYIAQNKDLIAKPMLSAVGEIGALALTEGSKALIKKLAAEKKRKKLIADDNNSLHALVTDGNNSLRLLDSNSKQILDKLISGSGIKKF